MNPFVGEIRIFPFNFAPKGWAFCQGQLMPISQNTALFSLLGTFYGGDGKSTFALPDLQGSVPVHQGQGQGLSIYDLGQQSGSPFITLLLSEIPFHTHTLNANDQDGITADPTGATLGRYSNAYQTNATTLQPMAFQALAPAGGSQPHNNMMPYLTFSFCIALQGVFPPRP